MQRIKTVTRDEDLFGTGKHGWKSSTPGPVTNGDDDFFNSVQEETARLCEIFATLAIGDSRNGMMADIKRCEQVVSVAGSAILETFDSNNMILGLAVGEDHLIAISDFSTPEGYRWDRLSESDDPVAHSFDASDTIADAAPLSGGGVVLVGASGGAAVHESWTWTGATPTIGTGIAGGGYTSIASDGTTYLVASDTLSTVYTSTDGLVWSATTGPSAADGIVSFAGGLFCHSEGTGGTFHTSPDGITWSAKTKPPAAGTPDFKHGATVGSRHYFYVFGGGEVWSTLDFTTWVDESLTGHMQQHGDVGVVFGTSTTLITENIGTHVRPIATRIQTGDFMAIGANRCISHTAAGPVGVDVRGSFF